MPTTARKTAFSRMLNRIVREGIATPAELAEVAECSARHIRNVAS